MSSDPEQPATLSEPDGKLSDRGVAAFNDGIEERREVERQQRQQISDDQERALLLMQPFIVACKKLHRDKKLGNDLAAKLTSVRPLSGYQTGAAGALTGEKVRGGQKVTSDGHSPSGIVKDFEIGVVVLESNAEKYYFSFESRATGGVKEFADPDEFIEKVMAQLAKHVTLPKETT